MNLKVIQTQIQPWTVAQGTTDTPRQGGWHPAVCLIRPRWSKLSPLRRRECSERRNPWTAAKKWGHLNSRAFEQASRAAGPAGPSGRGGAVSHWALDLTLMEGASVRGSWRIGGPFQSPTRAGMPLCHGEAVSAYLQAFRT